MLQESQKKTQSFNQVDKVYKVLFFLYIIGMIILVRKMSNIDGYFKRNGYGSTNFWELLLIVPGVIITWSLFQIIKKLSRGFILRNKSKHSRMSESEEDRVHRIQTQFNGIVYYSLSVGINWYLIHKYSIRYLPMMMGGELDITTYYSNWPEIPALPVRYFFMLSIGHHVERTIDHLTHGRNSKSFWLMMFHHMITINMMFCSFCNRQYLFGIPILLLHDMGDIFVALLRVVREIEVWKSLKVPFFINLVISWIITRMIIFNYEIVYPMLTREVFIVGGEYRNIHLFGFLGVTLLVVMNTYWLYGMLEAGYRKLVKNAGEAFALEGEVVDIESEKKEM